MVIRVLDVVQACNTAAEGSQVAIQLRKSFKTKARIRLSFVGVNDVPSSFVNAAIVPFLEQMGRVRLRERLIITDVTPQIAEMLRRCLDNAENGMAA